MSATNHTANYELSQYIGSDEPKYLTDYNGDMSKIDTAIKGVDTKAETANTGVATNASAISALDTAVSSLQTQVTTVAGVANGNTGSINTINSLIGNGEPTTQDKTIIGAINEIDAKIVDPSGLETRVSALETGVQSLGTDLEAAEGDIDTLEDKVGFPTRLDNGVPQYSADGGTTWANFSGALSIDEVESAEQKFTAKTGTLTYTFLSNHDEILIEITGSYIGVNGSAHMSSYTFDATVTNSGTSTPTLYHDTVFEIGDQALWSATNANVVGCRHIYHMEDVKAGDVLTITLDVTTNVTESNDHLAAQYTIFSVN